MEEAHLLKGLREDLVRNIIASTPDLRVLLISSTGLDHIPALGIEPLTTTRWRLSDVVDSTGKSIFSLTLPQLELIEFHEEPMERVMRGIVEEITNQFNASSDAELQSTLFRRSLASSPAALEARMRRLRNRLDQLGGSRDPFQGTLFPAEGDYVETDTSDLPYVIPERREGLRGGLSRGLKELESLSVDSKLNAFVQKLTAMRGDETEPHRICVFTEYRATVYYLQAQLKEAGFNIHTFHGALSLDDKAQSLERFKREGGVLLATMAMIKGIEFPRCFSTQPTTSAWTLSSL